MNAETTPGVPRGRLDAALRAVAILVSLAVAVVLVRTDIAYFQRLDKARILATLVPASGKLAGLSALDGSEWTAPDGMQNAGVLFGVAAAGEAGDMAYWTEVAARSRKTAPDLQFVGFCPTGVDCRQQPGAMEASLTLLRSMDPVQVHALTIGARQGRAFVFRGTRVLGMLPLTTDKLAFARNVSRLAVPAPRVAPAIAGGGA